MEPLIAGVGTLIRRMRPRGRHLVAELLTRSFAGRTITFRDCWGFVHHASFEDPMQALGFVGKPALPPELHRRLQTGDWVIDVGANIGIVTAELCHIVGPTGTIWAIEPFPPNLAKLERLKSENGLKGLKIHAGALSAISGVAHLGIPDDGNSGHPSLTRASDVDREQEVPVWALDDLVGAAAPDAPLAFIKIDVEGHEPKVLAGAARSLAELRPLVLAEFNDVLLREGGSSAKELLATFRELGYRPTAVFREGRQVGRVRPGTDVMAAFPFESVVYDLLLEPAGERVR